MLAGVDVQMMALETMIAIKFGRGLYPRPWPRAVLIGWALAAVLFGGVLLFWQYLLMQQEQQHASRPRRTQKQLLQQQQQDVTWKSD